MFPNIKKVKILTPIISNETMQSNLKCIQQSPAPSVLLLYTTVESTPKNSRMRLVGKFHGVYKKQQKKPLNIMQNSCYLVSASQFTNLLFYLGGKEAHGTAILSVQLYPTTPQRAQMRVPTLIFGELRE